MPDERPRRIAIQDRRRLFRDGLVLVLADEPDLEVVAGVATACELTALRVAAPLDVVILELDGPEGGPYRAVAGLLRRHPNLFVVGTWTGQGADPSLVARRAGVGAVFPCHAGVRALLDTVRNRPARRPVPSARRAVDVEDRPRLLSPREVEVLAAIGAGATTRSAAAALQISPKTVEHHKQRIFSKLDVQNQAHAVAVAIRLGLVAPALARREG